MRERVLSSEFPIPPDFVRVKGFVAAHLDDDAVAYEENYWVDEDLFTRHTLQQDYDLSDPLTIRELSFGVLRVMYATTEGRGNITEAGFNVFLSNRLNKKNALMPTPSVMVGWEHGGFPEDKDKRSISTVQTVSRLKISDVSGIMDKLDTLPKQKSSAS